jgi:cell division protein FtsL
MKKNKTGKLISRERRFVVLGAILLLFLWGVSFFMKNSLASINIEVERLSRDIKEQKEVNQSLTMKINELASLENVNVVANQVGLAYNNDNIRLIK